MNLRQLKYLIAIVEEGHFRRAATRCNATQPSLSNGIKQLELELGIPIFLRGRGQRLHGLTPEGQKVVKWARRILSDCDAMRDEIDAMQDDLRGELRIGAMSSMSPVLPTILGHVRKSFPNIKVDVRFIGHEAMKAGLDNFALDAAIFYMTTETSGRRNVLPLYTERFCLLVPDTDRFARATTITWADAAKLPLAMLSPSMHERSFFDEVFASVGAKPQPKVQSESILHLMFQVQYSELATIIPSHFARMPGLHKGTKALELVDPTRSRQVGMFWAETDTITPMAGVMVQAVRQLDGSEILQSLLEASPDSGGVDPTPEAPVPRSLPRRARRPKAVEIKSVARAIDLG